MAELEKKDLRLEDRTGQPLPAATEKDLLQARFIKAKPGDEITLREGTDSLMYDDRREITFGQALEYAERDGLVRRLEGEGLRYEKLTEITPERNSLDFLNRVVNRRDVEKLDSFDLNDQGELREYLGILAGRVVRDTAVQAGGLRPSLERSVDAMVDAALPILEKVKPGPGSDGFLPQISEGRQALGRAILEQMKKDAQANPEAHHTGDLERFYGTCCDLAEPVWYVLIAGYKHHPSVQPKEEEAKT